MLVKPHGLTKTTEYNISLPWPNVKLHVRRRTGRVRLSVSTFEADPRVCGHKDQETEIVGRPTTTKIFWRPTAANMFSNRPALKILGRPAAANNDGRQATTKIIGRPTVAKNRGRPATTQIIGWPVAAQILGRPTAADSD